MISISVSTGVGVAVGDGVGLGVDVGTGVPSGPNGTGGGVNVITGGGVGVTIGELNNTTTSDSPASNVITVEFAAGRTYPGIVEFSTNTYVPGSSPVQTILPFTSVKAVEIRFAGDTLSV